MSSRHSDCEFGEAAPFLHDEKDNSLEADTKDIPILRRQPAILCFYGRVVIYLCHLFFLAINVLWSLANLRYQSASCAGDGSLYGKLAAYCCISSSIEFVGLWLISIRAIRRAIRGALYRV